MKNRKRSTGGVAPEALSTDGASALAQPLIVVIGSSAGGLEALTALLSSLPIDLRATYVVAQHLAPDHDSSLIDLLGRATTLDVVAADDGVPLETGTIYVGTRGRDIRIQNGAIVAVGSPEGPGPNPSIDVLMTSLAESDVRSVGVILSGTGVDGSVGIRELHRMGAVTIAQLPESAKFEAMPMAAIATGQIDLVLAPEEMGSAIARVDSGLAHDTELTSVPSFVDDVDAVAGDGDREDVVIGAADHEQIDRILAALGAARGIDFSEYKESTIARQCARRQTLTGKIDLGTYRAFVESDADEAGRLAQALLVGVTSFFRDPEVWESLRRILVEVADPNREFRVWVPGCATGEEAYTVAMVAASAFGVTSDLARRIKIFATDLSEASLEVARRARYGDSSVSAIPLEYRERWIRPEGSRWIVAPAVREAIVFAQHNIAQDPPFPQIDLLTLRNTLIYFQPGLQQRVLHMCHFSLKPGGLLVLGTAERVGEPKGLFSARDEQHRIYSRLPGLASKTWTVRPKLAAGDGLSVRSIASASHESTQLHEALVAAYVPPGLVIDADGDVIEIVGDVSAWCSLRSGQMSHQAIALLHEEFRQTARQLLIQARHSHFDGVSRDLAGPTGPVRLTVRSVGPQEAGWQVLNFADLPVPTRLTPSQGNMETVSREQLDRVERELRITEKALQSTIEELETSNEELRSLNEELQASAEEIQASTEEVQASNEELEASNEQLNSLNTELQVRGNELSTSNAELQSIQSSLSSGLIIVDRDIKISRFTPLAVRLFPLIDSDVGRSLTDIPPTVPVPNLARALRECVSQGTRATVEVSNASQDFLVQLSPYTVSDGGIEGALLTISDVTDLLSARRRVARALADFEIVTDSLRSMVWQRGLAGELLFLNHAVEDIYGISRPHVLATPKLLVEAIHPDDRDRVLQAAQNAVGRWEVEYRIVRPDGTTRWVEESAIEVAANDVHEGYTVGSVLDVTARVAAEAVAKEAQAEATRQSEVLRAAIDTSYLGVVVVDADGHIVRVNQHFVDLVGIVERSLLGTSLATLIPNYDGPEDKEMLESVWSEPGVVHRMLRTHDGESLWVAVASHPVVVDVADPVLSAAWVVMVHDLTRIRDHTGELVLQARFDQLTGSLTRAHFRDRLNEELAREVRTGRGVAVLWLDLDGFKDVNDRHGHRAGDAVLREVATRLEGAGRRQDSVGRLGGDEFAMIVTEFNNLDSLEAVAARVLAVLRNPIPGPDGLLYITASIGIAIGPADGRDADALMHSADTAMYVAKEAGRDGHAYFQGEMNDAAERHASRRHDLTEALRHRNFEMAYQPVIDLRTGQIDMAEALVRWRRNGELVAAAEFIDVIKDSGQLRPLGNIVLALVDEDLISLDADGSQTLLPVSINLSPEELEGRELVNRLMDWEPPGGFSRIVIEVTEATLMAHQGRAVEALGLLRRLGATIAIDDFGTGFSNLAMLERLLPSIIKIDRSLLVSAEQDDQSRAILSAAITLAHALNARVVVEGIETKAQGDLATSHGADLGQGYFYTRPMPMCEMNDWGLAHKARADGAVAKMATP
jgi:two-component system CheB/CheR fusion protein